MPATRGGIASRPKNAGTSPPPSRRRACRSSPNTCGGLRSTRCEWLCFVLQLVPKSADNKGMDATSAPTSPAAAESRVGHDAKARDERRRSNRQEHVVQAWIVSPTAKDPAAERQEVKSVNVSRHGVAFSLSRPMPLRAFYLMDLAIGDQHIKNEIRIVSCRQVKPNHYEIGAEFF